MVRFLLTKQEFYFTLSFSLFTEPSDRFTVSSSIGFTLWKQSSKFQYIHFQRRHFLWSFYFQIQYSSYSSFFFHPYESRLIFIQVNKCILDQCLVFLFLTISLPPLKKTLHVREKTFCPNFMIFILFLVSLLFQIWMYGITIYN